MAAQGSNGKEKLQCIDLSSDDSEQSCKRPRQAAPESTPEQQSAHGPLKIRDRKGWEHGTMIDGNRHWKCKYCPMVGRSGGVTSLKHHVAGGSSRVRPCPSAPKDVSSQMKRLLDSTKQKPRKWTSRKATVVQPATATTSEPKNSVPLTSGVPCSTPSDPAEGYMPETYSMENGAFPSPASFMTRVVDMMLAAAELLEAEEESMPAAKKP
ncbi:hypothetical protein D1007_43124 [Hordeum vulgare]|nr:hypothetical protein D1007_43124 [Hordeum vulgare]